MDTKSKDEEKQYQCDTCSKQFSRFVLTSFISKDRSSKIIFLVVSNIIYF